MSSQNVEPLLKKDRLIKGALWSSEADRSIVICKVGIRGVGFRKIVPNGTNNLRRDLGLHETPIPHKWRDVKRRK